MSLLNDNNELHCCSQTFERGVIASSRHVMPFEKSLTLMGLTFGLNYKNGLREGRFI